MIKFDDVPGENKKSTVQTGYKFRRIYINYY